MSEDLFSQQEEPTNALEDGVTSPRPGALELPYVRNSSGQRMAFDEARLRASIERAQREAGEVVSSLANEVADIVRFTLSSRGGRAGGEAAVLAGAPQSGPPLHVDEIGALVERALLEVGATGTARSYIIARDRRMRARDLGHPNAEPLGGSVVSSDGSTSAPGPRLPSVRGATGAEPFQARRIVAALIEEVGLLPADAEQVASGVQSILAGSGLRVVSTGLVRELVSSQLLARGLGEAQRRHESVGIPRHDLAQLFQSATAESIDGLGGAQRFEDSVQRGLLRRWFLDDRLEASISQAHRTGDLFVGGLEALHRVRFRSMPAQLLLKGTGHSAFAALGRIGRLARDTSGGLLIEDIGLLHRALGSRQRTKQSAGSFALTLGALGGASDRRIDLAAGSQTEACVDALVDFMPSMVEALVGEPALPRIFAPLDCVAAAAARGSSIGDAAETLLWSGHLVPVWARAGGSWSGLDRAEGERGSMALGAAVGINLPRLARRAGPWREDVFLEAAAEAVESAAEALVNISAFQAHARGLHGTAASDRISYGILPVGLVDALRILGDGIARADQGSRILGFLDEASQRMGAARGLDARLNVGLATDDAESAAVWFARCDARASGPGQPRLFSDLPRPEEDRPRAYRASVGELTARDDSLRIRERAEALGSLLCTVPSGALVPASGSGEPSAASAARTADFQEELARAGRAVGGPASVAGAKNGPENLDLNPVEILLQKRARWPRLAAWARFAEVRAAATVPLTQAAETTLF